MQKMQTRYGGKRRKNYKQEEKGNQEDERIGRRLNKKRKTTTSYRATAPKEKPRKFEELTFPREHYYDLKKEDDIERLCQLRKFEYKYSPEEKEYPSLLIGFVSKINALGVFAGEDIPEDIIIAEVVGNKGKSEDPETGNAYLLDENTSIEPLNVTCFINSNRFIPNIKIKIIDNRIFLTSLKPIKKGCQCIVDYGAAYEVGIDAVLQAWDNHESWEEKVNKLKLHFLHQVVDEKIIHLFKQFGFSSTFVYVTPIISSILNNNLEELNEALEKYSDYKNWPLLFCDDNQKIIKDKQLELSPLMLACIIGKPSIVNILLNHQVEINQPSLHYYSALIYALSSPNETHVKLNIILQLVKAGANLKLQDVNNNSFLHHLIILNELEAKLIVSSVLAIVDNNVKLKLYNLLNKDNLCPILHAFKYNYLELAAILIDEMILCHLNHDVRNNKADILFSYFKEYERIQGHSKFIFLEIIKTEVLFDERRNISALPFIYNIFKQYNNNRDYSDILDYIKEYLETVKDKERFKRIESWLTFILREKEKNLEKMLSERGAHNLTQQANQERDDTSYLIGNSDRNLVDSCSFVGKDQAPVFCLLSMNREIFSSDKSQIRQLSKAEKKSQPVPLNERIFIPSSQDSSIYMHDPNDSQAYTTKRLKRNYNKQQISKLVGTFNDTNILATLIQEGLCSEPQNLKEKKSIFWKDINPVNEYVCIYVRKDHYEIFNRELLKPRKPLPLFEREFKYNLQKGLWEHQTSFGDRIRSIKSSFIETAAKCGQNIFFSERENNKTKICMTDENYQKWIIVKNKMSSSLVQTLPQESEDNSSYLQSDAAKSSDNGWPRLFRLHTPVKKSVSAMDQQLEDDEASEQITPSPIPEHKAVHES